MEILNEAKPAGTLERRKSYLASLNQLSGRRIRQVALAFCLVFWVVAIIAAVLYF